jgi:hypothetical protein
MTERTSRLRATADEQIGELLDLVSTIDEATARRPCPGREKLGDGTVAANARHTADNYERIVAFLSKTDRMSAGRAPGQGRAHRMPRALTMLGHRPPRSDHGSGGDPGQHDVPYTADNADLGTMVEQLGTTRDALARVSELSDSQLDAIPPAGSVRFADGKRTVEEVLAGLLKHQRHQLDALEAAIC